MIFNPFMKLLSKSSVVACFSFLFFSCGSGTTDTPKETTDSIPVAELKTETKKQNIFYSIPSPIQLGRFLQKSGAKFDKKLLNSIDNISTYSTTSKKALNLGVYGADLSFSAIFNQAQETSSYLKVSKKLAEDLGISEGYSKETIKRMEANVSNKDSVLQIISEIFLSSNESLKENEQSNISTLVISGGFIEGLYIGTRIVKTLPKNEGVISRIAELKGSLTNLIAMLNLEKQDAEIVGLLNDLNSLKEIYDQMVITEVKPVANADTTKNTLTIAGNSRYNLTKEQIEKITERVEVIRTKIIKH